jgi:hypothetical protein
MALFRSRTNEDDSSDSSELEEGREGGEKEDLIIENLSDGLAKISDMINWRAIHAGSREPSKVKDILINEVIALGEGFPIIMEILTNLIRASFPKEGSGSVIVISSVYQIISAFSYFWHSVYDIEEYDYLNTGSITQFIDNLQNVDPIFLDALLGLSRRLLDRDSGDILQEMNDVGKEYLEPLRELKRRKVRGDTGLILKMRNAILSISDGMEETEDDRIHRILERDIANLHASIEQIRDIENSTSMDVLWRKIQIARDRMKELLEHMNMGG